MRDNNQKRKINIIRESPLALVQEGLVQWHMETGEGQVKAWLSKGGAYNYYRFVNNDHEDLTGQDVAFTVDETGNAKILEVL